MRNNFNISSINQESTKTRFLSVKEAVDFVKSSDFESLCNWSFDAWEGTSGTYLDQPLHSSNDVVNDMNIQSITAQFALQRIKKLAEFGKNGDVKFAQSPYAEDYDSDELVPYTGNECSGREYCRDDAGEKTNKIFSEISGSVIGIDEHGEKNDILISKLERSFLGKELNEFIEAFTIRNNQPTFSAIEQNSC